MDLEKLQRIAAVVRAARGSPEEVAGLQKELAEPSTAKQSAREDNDDGA